VSLPSSDLEPIVPGDPGLPEDRSSRSRLLEPFQAKGAKGVWIAVASTLIFFGVLLIVVVNSSGWPEVKRQFFNGEEFTSSFPGILRAFWVNVQLFLIAEAIVLVFALVIAVLRSLPGPVFFPIRALAIAYTDIFRSFPTILVVYALGLGMPALQLAGVPKSPFFWAIVSLVLVYSAYVAEVYRAGIESVHESQVAAARSLGLSRWQSTRYVVLPQAVRRVIPPLLNDFIGLQKDTVLVSFIGVVEAFRTTQIDSSNTFNYTPFVALGLIYLLVTVPMTRLVDHLVKRDRRRRQAGAPA
jgi:polar amino acid transport system permease protein